MNHSKFTIPRQSNLLARERLIHRLGAWDDKKLVIVHAQAGQGKSTLAAGYAASLAQPTVWYTMDAGDDDPAVFLAGIAQAVSSALPDKLPKVPPPFRSRSGINGSEPALARWVAQLFGNLTRPCLIVFDDYHFTAASPPLRAMLKVLFEGTPTDVRFLLLSRTRPELDIAKLRARRAVADLRSSDLKFSDQEVQELFGTVFAMPLAPAEAAAINAIAEGWPAGLVLLHGFLVNVPSQDRLAALAGSRLPEFRSHIFGYLAEEVFAHLHDDLQHFLMRTAVAGHLTLPLLSALSGLPENAPDGGPSVGVLVRELSEKNLFVSSVDTEGSVIRYHALFREFLLKTFQVRNTQAEVRRHYAIAARWFKSAGDPVRAIELWIESGQEKKALREIESSAQDLIASGRAQTLLRWLRALPKVAAERPWFLFTRAVDCRFTAPAEALRLYEEAYKGFHRDRCAAGQMLALSGIIEACFHMGGDFARMGHTAVRAQALLAKSKRASRELRARLLLAMGMAWFFTGRLQQGARALQQALELFRQQEDHFSRITSAIYLIPCALYQGDFALARDTVKKGFEASNAIPEETSGRAALFLTKAMVALFEGSFSEAQDCIDQCKSLADSHALESIGLLSLDIEGWLKIAQGDYRGAEKVLAECKRKGEKARNAFFSASAAHLLAIALLFQGRLDRARTESDTALALQQRSGSRLFQAIYRIASGAILLRLGRVSRAETELLTALKVLRQLQAVQQEANAHLLLASLYLGRGSETKARHHLASGFSIGQERGFTYYALLTHDELSSLAAQAICRDIEQDYCRRLTAGPSLQQARPLIRIFCLGDFRVLRSGIPIGNGEWKSKLAKTLVKLLAVRGSQKLTRDEAAEMLWPDANAAQKPLLLNSLLHRTRRVLEPEGAPSRADSCIIQDGGLLYLNPRKVWTDVQEFGVLHAATRQKRMSSENDPGNTLSLYDQAFSLYQGDILPGDLYLDWAHGHREHFKKIHADMLTHAAVLTEAQDDMTRSFIYYERIFSLDPCNEKACRWLMAWHVAAGQRSDAVRLFERCQLALRKELDIEPDEQTKILYRNIIGG